MSAWVNEYRNPSHEEFRVGTAWGLQNAFTEVAKKWNFATMQNRTEGLIQVMDEALDFEDKYLDWIDSDLGWVTSSDVNVETN